MTEALRIKSVIHGSVGKKAVAQELGHATFMLRNTHPTQTLYFKEQGRDGISATAANAASLPAGEVTAFPLRADVLSLAGSDGATTYELVLLD
ncbi:MAG: hypothetical protein IKL89_01045 [Clostridia bacterium]|nr:hypothetical protein [Clostridia bacterium]